MDVLPFSLLISLFCVTVDMSFTVWDCIAFVTGVSGVYILRLDQSKDIFCFFAFFFIYVCPSNVLMLFIGFKTVRIVSYFLCSLCVCWFIYVSLFFFPSVFLALGCGYQKKSDVGFFWIRLFLVWLSTVRFCHFFFVYRSDCHDVKSLTQMHVGNCLLHFCCMSFCEAIGVV